MIAPAPEAPTENRLVLGDGDYPIAAWQATQLTANVLASAPALNPRLKISNPECFEVGDKIFVCHRAGTCGGGIYGCAKIESIEANGWISISGHSLDVAGDADGVIFKMQSTEGWVGLLAIYSSLTDSPVGLTGAIDANSNQMLIQSGPGGVAPGDKVWLPAAGIVGAAVQRIQEGTVAGKKSTIAVLSQFASTTVAVQSPVTREGQILAYAKLEPDECGLMSGYLDRRDIQGLPTAEECGCSPCAPMAKVGCYQILAIRGEFSEPGSGYPLYVGDFATVQETGMVYRQKSVVSIASKLIA